ncbi:MAG: pitrilysin family protein [Candidatus Kapabacteria bacterium]|nr:pitrilysin family protein [Candidatus Kapabacteria bacterium]
MPHITTHDVTLSNGLRVIVCPDNGAPVVNVTVMYKVGSHDEHRGKTGLAHLFEHLMFDNAEPGSDKQYDLYCTKAGGSNNAYTTFDYTCYHIDLPAHQVELGYWLEAERMRGFRITEHALQTQRSVVVEEINQNVFNQPYGTWRKALQAVAYDERSSYSWDVYGSADDVSGVSMDDARGFFERFYHPSNAVLCVSGDVSVDRAIDLANKHFGSIADAKQPIERTTFDDSFRRNGTHTVVEDNVPMSAVFVSIHLPGFLHNELLDADLASTILGVGRSSVLYKELVSEKRIASGVGAYVDRRAHSTLLTMYAYASDETTQAETLAQAIESAIRGFVLGDSQLETAMNRMRTGHAAELQRVSGVADTVAHSTLFWNDPVYANTVLERYSSVTKQAVADILSRCGDPTQTVRVDVVPKELSHSS